MIKIACDLATVKCTKDARRWLQKFTLPATKLRKNIKAPSAGCCDSLLLKLASSQAWHVWLSTRSRIFGWVCWKDNALYVIYSQTRSSVLPKNQDLVLLFRIWIRSSFELLKLKSKNGQGAGGVRRNFLGRSEILAKRDFLPQWASLKRANAAAV